MGVYCLKICLLLLLVGFDIITIAGTSSPENIMNFVCIYAFDVLCMTMHVEKEFACYFYK